MIGTKYKFRQYNAMGQLLWASDGPKGIIVPRLGEEILRGSKADLALAGDQAWSPNALANEGEQDILEAFFRGGTVPANFYVGLINDAGIAETDTLATMVGEPSTNGYARDEVTFGATTLDAGDYETTSTTGTFTASGGSIGPVDHLILTDVSSGTAGSLLAYVPLSQSRTLSDGDSLNTDVAVKLQ